MCDHMYEVQGEVLEVQFDEYDMAEVVEREVWMCYDCRQVINNENDQDSSREVSVH